MQNLSKIIRDCKKSLDNQGWQQYVLDENARIAAANKESARRRRLRGFLVIKQSGIIYHVDDDFDAFDRPPLDTWGLEDHIGWRGNTNLCAVIAAKRGLDRAAGLVQEARAAATPCSVPPQSYLEFQPPRPVRGLEVTLAPRLLPIPVARSCHVN